jgi:hypothetical protein
LIFDLSKIDPLETFESPEMRAGMLLLKIIREPWDEFIEGWQKIREILTTISNLNLIRVNKSRIESEK